MSSPCGLLPFLCFEPISVGSVPIKFSTHISEAAVYLIDIKILILK